MALDGGGGGGPVGIANSFTGPSQQIEIAGDFAYGYSGEIIINNSTASMIETTTGNYTFVGSFSFGVDRNAALGGNKQLGFTITMNGSKVFQQVTYTNASHGPLDMDNNYDIIIPPYTEIKIEAETDEADNIPTFGMLVGRIYRG